MDAVLTDPDVNTWFEICILILLNVIVPKFECAGEVWQANAKFVNYSADGASQKQCKMLKYDEYFSIRTIPMYVPTLRVRWRRENVQMLYVWNMPEARLLAMVGTAAWEQILKARARVR